MKVIDSYPYALHMCEGYGQLFIRFTNSNYSVKFGYHMYNLPQISHQRCETYVIRLFTVFMKLYPFATSDMDLIKGQHPMYY